jgi:hypothetical protein
MIAKVALIFNRFPVQRIKGRLRLANAWMRGKLHVDALYASGSRGEMQAVEGFLFSNEGRRSGQHDAGNNDD